MIIGKYTKKKLLRKLKKEMPEDACIRVVFSQTIRASLHEYYLIFIDDFTYSIYEKVVEKEGVAGIVEIISSLYLEDKMKEILGG